MPPKPERFNAKARSSGHGTHSHKQKHVAKGGAGGAPDAAELAEQAAAEAAKVQNMTASQRRAHELMQELVAQNTERGGAAMSTKKRKRFEAFVAKQMKKEEHNALLASLAQSSADVGDRSQLVSSSTLGTGRVRTTAARLQDEKDRAANIKLAHGAPRQGGVYHSVADDLDADLDDLPDAPANAAIPRVAGVKDLEKTSDQSKAGKLAPADRPEGEQLEDADRRARIEAATHAYAQATATANAPTSASAATAPRSVGSALAGAPVRRAPRRKPRKRVKRSAPAPESDFDSSESSASESGEPEISPVSPGLALAESPLDQKGEGKGKEKEKGKSVELDQGSDESQKSDERSHGSHTDEEMEEDYDAAIIDELKRRGMNPKDYGYDDASDDDTKGPHKDANEPVLSESSKGKGKGKSKSVSFVQSDDGADEHGSETDAELEEEEDAAIVAELVRRGIDPKQFGFNASSDHEDSPTPKEPIEQEKPAFASDKVKSKGKRETQPRDESESDPHPEKWEAGSQTDSEMEEEEDAAIVSELIRRGMDPKTFGYDVPSDTEPSSGKKANTQSGEPSASASPPWEGFASEDEDAAEISSQSSSSSSSSTSDEEQGSEEDATGDKDEEDEQHKEQQAPARKERSSGFKEWAQQALAASGAGRPEDAAPDSEAPTEEGKPLEPVMGLKIRVGDTMQKDGRAHGPLGDMKEQRKKLSAFAQTHYAESSKFPSSLVLVPRSESEQEARLKLPVVGDEDDIVKTILENPVTVLCGETGSGKTTQVPQFLYERGFGTAGSRT